MSNTSKYLIFEYVKIELQNKNMLDSRVIYLLKTLKQNKRELREFEKFVTSPYHNSKEEVKDLFLLIKKYWRYLDTEKGETYLISKGVLEKGAVYSLLFPKEKDYLPTKMNECMSDLSKLIEDFFVNQELKKQPRPKQMLLLNALKNRGIDDYYFNRAEHLGKKLTKEMNTATAHNAQLYYDIMQLNEHRYYHPNHHKSTIEENNRIFENVMNGLDTGFIIKKLQFACEMKSRENVFGFKYSIRLLEQVKAIAKVEFQDHKTIQCYLKILDLFDQQSVDQIPEVESLVKDIIENSNVDFKLDILLKFMNALPPYSGRMEHYFQLYKYALKSEILIEHRYISADHFNNILTLATVLKKKDWAVDFVTNYSQYLKLEKDNVENIKTLFQAQLDFNEKKYREAFILLDKLRIKDVTYGLRYYPLLIMTIIEGRETIRFKFDFFQICRNFQRYLNRSIKDNKLSPSLGKDCKRFTQLAKIIYDWEYKSVDKKLIIKELEGNGNIPHKNWLLQKIKIV